MKTDWNKGRLGHGAAISGGVFSRTRRGVCRWKILNCCKSVPCCRNLYVRKRVDVCSQPAFRADPSKHAPNSHDCCLSALAWS
jgi:hypothetical protein